MWTFDSIGMLQKSSRRAFNVNYLRRIWFPLRFPTCCIYIFQSHDDRTSDRETARSPTHRTRTSRRTGRGTMVSIRPRIVSLLHGKWHACQHRCRERSSHGRALIVLVFVDQEISAIIDARRRGLGEVRHCYRDCMACSERKPSLRSPTAACQTMRNGVAQQYWGTRLDHQRIRVVASP